LESLVVSLGDMSKEAKVEGSPLEHSPLCEGWTDPPMTKKGHQFKEKKQIHESIKKETYHRFF